MSCTNAEQKNMRTIIKSSGEFTIKAGHNVYELNLETGLILLATLEDCVSSKGQPAKKIVEKPLHIYLPALNKEHAKGKFNSILNSVK